MSRALLLKRPSLLAYPGGNPGFDPSHVASKGIVANRGFSGVASAGNFISLLSGKAGTKVGTPSAIINSAIGPGVVFTAATDAISFSGQSTVAQNNSTFAAIVWSNSLNSFTVANSIISVAASGFNNNCLCYDANGDNLQVELDSNVFGTGTLKPLIKTPYFVIGSVSGGSNTNYLILNLATGQIQTQVVTTAGVPATPQGTISIGNNASQTSAPFGGIIAAIMYAPTYMSMADMLKWAQDPWSFWYPSTLDLSMMLAAPSGSGTSVNLGGAGCTASAGSFGVSDTFVITGASCTASAGSVVPNPAVLLTGAAAAVAAGVLTETATASPAISGASATSAAGTLVPSVSTVLVGAGASASAGTVAPQDSDRLTGAAVAASAGTVTPSVAVTLTGASVSVAAGSVSFSGATSAPISGAVVAAAAGSVSPSVSVSLAGAQAIVAAGAVSFAGATLAPITGTQASALAGTLTDALQIILSGASTVALAGSLAPMTAENLIGAAVAGQAGSLFSTIAVTLSGAQASAQAGTVSTPRPGSASLVGASVQALAGQVLVVIGQAVIRKTIYGHAGSPVTLAGKGNRATITGNGDKAKFDGKPY